ncbi:hypothetical protein V7138_08915 [Bacillus sp. JJ1533]|uniref:hypothetical protein n=1 Tax=Bacillus sp. JJ1533 TaxID=3122959 RepID=UPI002FFF0EBB
MKSKKRQMDIPEDTIQLKQRIIHYHSEIASYENKLMSLKQLLEKEKIRTQFLHERLFKVEEEQIEPFQREIISLKEKLLKYEVALEEEKKRANLLQQKVISSKHTKDETIDSTINQKSSPQIQAYFAYSMLIPDQHEEQKEVVIIGDFILKNIGNEILRDIILCIKLSPIDAGTLSGKISLKSPKNDSSIFANSSDNNWEFLHDNWREKIKTNGEYWIKYTDSEPLKPEESIHFSQFDIRLPINETSKSVIVDGYVYCKEIPEGAFSLNKIIINF